MSVDKTEKKDMPDSDLAETGLESELRHKGLFFNVYRDKVRLPDGHDAFREYIRHPGAVVILPLLEDGRFLLEKQFRYPLDRTFVEFPAGKIDAGEDPLSSAKRELLEETGYTAGKWQFICAVHNAIGYSDEVLYLYLASELKQETSRLDDEEFIEIFSATLSELLGWVREGKITDAKTIIGTFWLEKIQAGEWEPTEYKQR